MSYSILILRRAGKELAGLTGDPYERVKTAIASLADNPRPRGCRKLAGREGWRIRIGDYRVVYEIDDEDRELTILHIGLRKDVYR
jgi:mRNA interferase RelE/StbE